MQFHQALRPAAAGDIPALVALLRQLGYDSDPLALRRRLELISAHSEHHLHVAIDEDGQILGMIHAQARVDMTRGPHVEIEALVVGINARRSGVGRSLVRGAELWAARLGYYEIVVRTQLHRSEAQAFYQRLGYVEIKQQAVLVREHDELRPAGPKTIAD